MTGESKMTTGPLAGILSRAVVVLDANDYGGITPSRFRRSSRKPDYAKALAAVEVSLTNPEKRAACLQAALARCLSYAISYPVTITARQAKHGSRNDSRKQMDFLTEVEKAQGDLPAEHW